MKASTCRNARFVTLKIFVKEAKAIKFYIMEGNLEKKKNLSHGFCSVAMNVDNLCSISRN